MQDKENKLVVNSKSKARKELFDLWAKSYNNSVLKSEKNGTYPFVGYSEVKYKIIETICNVKSASILEMGIGTGEITKPLYDLEYAITGVDLSEKMIDRASEKMPKAEFILGSFKDAVNQIHSKYNFIIFSYSIHHLDREKQVELLVKLDDYLLENGLIIIGDVSTFTKPDMEKLKEKYIRIWDEEEHYPVFQEYQFSQLSKLYHINYEQINEVAGVYILERIKTQ